MIGLIIVSVFALSVMGTGYYAYRKIRRKVRDFSQQAFGTPDIMQGFRDTEVEYQNTPKSVAGVTSVYLPKITRDFPEFHFVEMKRRAENVLTSYLRSVDEQDASRLTEGLNELKDKLKLRIGALQEAGKEEHFQSVRIHRTELSGYRKYQGKCSVTFQSSVQYYYWVEKDGQIKQGSKNNLYQSRYDVEMLYIQDRDAVENLEDGALALTCPNCGAPLPELGATKCAYCDTPFRDVRLSVRIWNFSDVREVR